MARGVFGDLFDYDRDGELDPAEQSFEFAFMEQQEKEALLDDYRDNPLGLDPDDFDSPEEFLEAYEEKDAWVNAIDLDESILADELYIDPADYDSYEEFHDALIEEKAYLRETFPGFTKEKEKELLTPDPMPEPIAEEPDETDPDPVSNLRPDPVHSPVPAETIPADEADIPVEETAFDPNIEINDNGWESLPPEEKKRALYERQKTMLADFLERGAISQAEYDKSLRDMTAKMGYESDIPDEVIVFDPGIEIKDPKHRSSTKWIMALVILAAAVAALVMYARQMRTVHVQQCYTSAELYIAAGEYQLAIDELDAIKNSYHIDTFLDSAPLRDLCEAHIELNAGDSQEAFDLLKNKQPFEYQSADFIQDYNDFVRKVEDAHNQDLAKQRQKELEQKQKAADRKAEFREELKHRLPYIGMDESYINDTSLGKYDKADIGKTYSYYTFYTNSSSYYYVTCENGKVISANQFSRSTSSGSTSKSSSTKKSDPYDVYDYSDPDDFFYDHYDDFWDFEDAEDYYYDHVR